MTRIRYAFVETADKTKIRLSLIEQLQKTGNNTSTQLQNSGNNISNQYSKKGKQFISDASDRLNKTRQSVSQSLQNLSGIVGNTLSRRQDQGQGGKRRTVRKNKKKTIFTQKVVQNIYNLCK